MKSIAKFIKDKENFFIKEEHINEEKTCFDGPDFFGSYYYDTMNYKYFNKDTGKPSLDEIEQSVADANNVTGDPSFCTINGISFTKYKKNKWQASSGLAHAIGGTQSDKEIFQLLKDTNNDWYAMLRMEKK